MRIADRLSVVALDYFGAKPESAAAFADVDGYRGLVFNCYGGVDLTELSDTGRREWLRGATRRGAKLTALQIDIGRNGMGPGRNGLMPGVDVERQLLRIRNAITVTAQLKAGLLCIELGQVPRASAAAASKPAITPDLAGAIIIPTTSTPAAPAPEVPSPDPKFVAQVQYALSEIAILCDRQGVAIAFSASLSSLASLVAAIRPLDCPYFGIDLDPVTILQDGIDEDAAFSLVSHSINHVRLKDALVGDDRRVEPALIGQGNVRWQAFLSALESADYGGMLTVDPTQLDDQLRAARFAPLTLHKMAEAL